MAEGATLIVVLVIALLFFPAVVSAALVFGMMRHMGKPKQGAVWSIIVHGAFAYLAVLIGVGVVKAMLEGLGAAVGDDLDGFSTVLATVVCALTVSSDLQRGRDAG